MDSLTPAQQATLNLQKSQIRLINETFLRQHPELKHLISFYMSKVLKDRPDDVLDYTVRFMTGPGVEAEVFAAMGEPTTFGS